MPFLLSVISSDYSMLNYEDNGCTTGIAEVKRIAIKLGLGHRTAVDSGMKHFSGLIGPVIRLSLYISCLLSSHSVSNGGDFKHLDRIYRSSSQQAPKQEEPQDFTRKLVMKSHGGQQNSVLLEHWRKKWKFKLPWCYVFHGFHD